MPDQIIEATEVAVEDRNDNFTILPDKIIYTIGKEIGPLGIAIYSVIAAHRNRRTGVAFPGTRRIAELLGITRDTVMRGLKKLEEIGIIRIEKERGIVNKYVVTNQYLWKKGGLKFPPVEKSYRGGLKIIPPLAEKLGQNQIELTRSNNQIQDWQVKNAKYQKEKSTGKRKLKVVNGKPQFLKA